MYDLAIDDLAIDDDPSIHHRIARSSITK